MTTLSVRPPWQCASPVLLATTLMMKNCQLA
jgi:hypothetical protein